MASQTGSLSRQQARQRALQQTLERAVKDFEGEVGIHVRHLGTGETASIWPDELFPTASMIKVPILLTLFDRIEKGELSYHTTLTWDRKRVYAGDDLLAKFEDGSRISIPKLVMLMETMSDNTASLWLQELAGTGTRINQWLAANGYEKTRMNSRTPRRKKDWETYGWGQTTPREMCELLVQIRQGRAFSKGAADEMYRNLTRSFWNDGALSQIPPYVQAASKQGAVDESRSEVVLVNAPHGDYVFCIITKNQKDQRWQPDNAGNVLLRRISRLLWQHFEPDSRWSPPEGAAW